MKPKETENQEKPKKLPSEHPTALFRLRAIGCTCSLTLDLKPISEVEPGVIQAAVGGVRIEACPQHQVRGEG